METIRVKIDLDDLAQLVASRMPVCPTCPVDPAWAAKLRASIQATLAQLETLG